MPLVRVFACAALLALSATTLGAQRYDLILANGVVIDGTGTPRYRADVAFLNGRIALVSRTAIPQGDGRRVIDATGMIVSPGFIDMHAHLEPLMSMPDAESHVRQGVTLALGAPDGGGPLPLGPYLDSLTGAGLGINVAFLVGHNSVRRQVMGTENRDPTPREIASMKSLVGEAMRNGAFGLSTGLRYVPGTYSRLPEVVELARAAAAAGGIYTSHLREEGTGLIDGVAEALEIGRLAKVPVVLTHHKAIGKLMWGKSRLTLAMVDSARRAGTQVLMDQYPYAASYTDLSVLMPPWALAGGSDALKARMDDPALRDSILRGIVNLLETDRGGGDLRRVQFSRSNFDPTLNGRTLHDWVVKRGLEPTMQNAAPMIVEGVLAGGGGMVYHVMDEEDVKRIMAHPMTMIASDGRLTKRGDGVPHPRNYGTFPRVLGRYVRDQRVITLEDAVRKMTSLPARTLGLASRGCLAAGCSADVVVFDPAKVRDVGTFEDPHHYPDGIPWVFVNGAPVVEQGQLSPARPGRVLRRP
ncbi:MAG: N-acyl-D-amino-acid deacylase family protein [Gemmatimonadota bacterium]